MSQRQPFIIVMNKLMLMKDLALGLVDRGRRRLLRSADSYRARQMLDSNAMSLIHEINKSSLKLVDEWITDDVWMSSVFQYGLPKEIRHLIDRDLGSAHTYTDALLALCARLAKPINYLEIGVSVGKNFWQVLNYLKSSTLSGFDIEEINPTLGNRLRFSSRVEFETSSDSMKKSPSSLSTFSFPATQNEVQYLCGDIFDPGAWKQLRKHSFNLIFSDAFHSADALYVESAEIIRNDLLDPDTVIIMWDDLHNEMEHAFRVICKDLSSKRPDHKNVWFVASLKGWLGDNWEDHPIGFFISQRR